MAIVHTSKIEFSVELDENRVPENIHWSAEDGGIQNEASKAVMLSVWDSVQKDTLRMDLWTKDMPVDQMNVFFHQTLVSLAESYLKATNNEKMNDTFNQFCDYFAEKLELKKK